MAFHENLHNLRKSRGISQEQLAQQLGVSRQAVSKWESGVGYPETEKIFVLCDLFDCSMDALMKGSIDPDGTNAQEQAESAAFWQAYREFSHRFAAAIALAVGLILAGVTVFLIFAGFAAHHPAMEEIFAIIGVVILLLCVAAAVPILIFFGIQTEKWKQKELIEPEPINEEERSAFQTRFAIAIAGAVSLILLGVVVLVLLYGVHAVSETSMLPVVILMACVTLAVTVLIYFGILKERIYSDDANPKQVVSEGEEKASGVIMLTATAVYLLLGFVWKLWHPGWVVFPIGGILCGIVSVITHKEQK